MNRNKFLGYGMFFIVVLLLLVAIFTLFTHSLITSQAKDNYCNGVYPSNLGEDYGYGFTYGIENGYIKCCKYVYVSHIKTQICEVFPYIK